MDPRQHAVAALNRVGGSRYYVDDDRVTVVEAVEQEIALAVDEERERCARLVEIRATELEPLEGKPDMVAWEHGFLLGLASAIRAK